jgi:hypothetical protein
MALMIACDEAESPAAQTVQATPSAATARPTDRVVNILKQSSWVKRTCFGAAGSDACASLLNVARLRARTRR